VSLFAVPVHVGQASIEELDVTRLPPPVQACVGSLPTAARRQTYAAGRLAAARAIRSATGLAYWLGTDGSGLPLWPPGLTGSLTHTQDIAVCVVSACHYVRLGVDVEPVASAAGLHAARRLVCTGPERRQVEASDDPALAVLRLFCAKEALFKSLPAELQTGWRFTGTGLRWSEPPSPATPVALVAVGDRDCPVLMTSVMDGLVLAAVTRGRNCPGIPGSSRTTIASGGLG
jgi:4'-phosphopantetheinyl transferase EntD